MLYYVIKNGGREELLCEINEKNLYYCQNLSSEALFLAFLGNRTMATAEASVG